MGIKLVELREAWQEDSSGKQEIDVCTLEIDAKVTIKRAKIISIDLGSVQITDEDELMTLRFPGHAFILSPDGRKIAFDQFVNSYCREVGKREQLLKPITLAYPHVKGKLIRNYSDTEVEIEKLVFTGFLSQIDASSKKSFQVVDQVWMIMKEIFGKNHSGYPKVG